MSDKENNKDKELSEESLDQVSGGAFEFPGMDSPTLGAATPEELPTDPIISPNSDVSPDVLGGIPKEPTLPKNPVDGQMTKDGNNLAE